MADAFEFVEAAGGIQSYIHKKNGLKCLVAEDHSAPVATLMVTYHVGSRNEGIGYTGSTHLLEHLLFKGSTNFNKDNGKSIWSLLQAVGAQINATTWNDRTLLPIEHIDMAAAIEADRMRNAFLNESDKNSEMTVVRNEFERGENDPMQALDKAIWAAAYVAHPYHHSTIGWRSDIENVPIQRLKDFYQTFYWPNNSTLTIAGDMSTPDALALAEKHFGSIPPSPHPIPPMYTAEPPQEGPRRVVVKRPGQQVVVAIAHKTPRALDKDSYPLLVMARVLGVGKSARLYKRLVDTAVCTRVMADNEAFRDAGLFSVAAFLTPAAKAEDVESQLLEEIEKIKESGITAEELERAKQQIRANNAFSRDGTYSVASRINEAIAIGSWRYYTDLPANVEAVTLDDVQRVAKRYFDEDWRTTGWFIPKMEKDKNIGLPDSEKVPDVVDGRFAAGDKSKGLAAKAKSEDDPGNGTIASRIVEMKPLEGCTLYAMPTPAKDIIKIQGSLLGGELFSKPMVTSVFAAMLSEGTKKRTKFEIGELLENRGASLSFDGESDVYRIKLSGRCLKEDLGVVLELLGEMLREPRMDAADFENTKKRMVTNLTKRKENTGFMATQRVFQELFPPEHPNYARPIDEDIEAVKAMSVEDLLDFHSKIGLGDLTVVAVGDVNPALCSDLLKKSLGGWQTTKFKIEPPKTKAAPPHHQDIVVQMPGKTSCNVAFALPIGIDREDPDFWPLYLSSFVLGGNFSARLMQTVRDRDGLTYGINSSVAGTEDRADGVFQVMATFAPALIEKGVASTMEQLNLWAKDGITPAELEEKKKTVTGTYKVRLATCDGLASAILTNANRRKPTSYLDDFSSIVNAVTLADVQRAMKRIDVAKLTVVKAGSIDGAKL
ncbi:peptidase M16 domain-containing protein [Hyaloraphidium curvatum]|nr:peptidase M16 domain-containing protein [Hyaloraphidium curvatum]